MLKMIVHLDVVVKNGHVEIAKWLHSLGTDIRAEDDFAFKLSCEKENFEIAKWLHEIDPMIISENVRNVRNLDYEQLGISEQTAILFECIKNNTEFPEIDEIDDCILHSLKYYNMIDHLTKLSLQFPYIYFYVEDGKITEFAIDRPQMKSARNLF